MASTYKGKVIRISERTYDDLLGIKSNNRYKNMDNAIKSLIENKKEKKRKNKMLSSDKNLLKDIGF